MKNKLKSVEELARELGRFCPQPVKIYGGEFHPLAVYVHNLIIQGKIDILDKVEFNLSHESDNIDMLVAELQKELKCG